MAAIIVVGLDVQCRSEGVQFGRHKLTLDAFAPSAQPIRQQRVGPDGRPQGRGEGRGRGLLLVDLLATTWGAHHDDEAGNAVWFQVGGGRELGCAATLSLFLAGGGS